MLEHPIELLGLQPVKEKQFLNKGLSSIESIAMFFPRKYYDFRKITPVHDAVVGEYAVFAGIVLGTRISEKVFTAIVEEDQEYTPGVRARFEICWFGTDYHIRKMVVGERFVFCGRVTSFLGRIQINSPLAYSQNERHVCRIFPVYSRIPGMSQEYLDKQIKASINYLKAHEQRTEKQLFAARLGLMPKFKAIEEIHNPSNDEMYKNAKRRIAYEEIYDFYTDLKQKDLYLVGTSMIKATKDAKTRNLIKSLPFALTADQQSVIDTIFDEIKSGHRIHSLITGDVGCGKTMIALLSAVYMWENGFQTIIMAPTLVLAQQHFNEMTARTSHLDIKIRLLTTETKAGERKKILADFESGKIDILVGTHAVLSDNVVPSHLGLTIIDEEHKFGVKQKQKLEEYDKAGVHHISMTATPIPRSIAMAVYGNDLDVLQIRTMPAGRKAIKTKQCFDMEDALKKIYEEVMDGHQAYIVCPFIEDSESDKFKDVMSVQTAKQQADEFFAKQPNFVHTAVISGDMKQDEILKTINEFASGNIDVLISTTIVEVGVNVPNASVIAVMSAERFGLAALHQLRGRVGRGRIQSYCLLCSSERKDRLDVMCSTTDGFEIAEKDLNLRGPGDLTGEAQSGQSRIIETILKRPKLAKSIKEKIFDQAR